MRLVFSFCLFIIASVASADDQLNCKYDVTESIPEGLVYPSGPLFNSTFQELVSLVSNARETLDIASFYWSLLGTDVMHDPDKSSIEGEQLLKTILKAAKRRVDIRIAVNMDANGHNLTSNEDLHMLQEAGASIRFVNFTNLVGAGILHTKFIIADNSSFYVGSANMDWRSLTQVKELGIVVFDCPPVARDMAKVFEVYWYLGQIDVELPTDWPDYLSTAYNKDTPLEIKMGGSASQVYISSSPKQFNPEGRTNDIDAILFVINGASKFIYIAVMDYFPTFLYTYPPKFWPVIDDAIRKAAIERNVEVRLLGSHWKHTRRSMFTFLKSLDAFYNFSKTGGKIEAKLFEVPTLTPEQANIPFSRVNHNKYMVTDKTAYIGTSNWSADYFVSTGGVALVVREGNASCYQELSLRKKLVSIFERDWFSKYSHLLFEVNEAISIDDRDATPFFPV